MHQMAQRGAVFPDNAADASGAGSRAWFAWPWRKQSRKSGSPEMVRKRIAIWAVVIGVIFGFFDVARPLDDAYRLRLEVTRPHKADGKTVIVAIDDQSLTELGVRDPLRSDDAKLLDRLFASGAKRVVFDRAYADPSTPADDRQLIAALERHRGRIYIGSTGVMTFGFSQTEQLLTHPRFIGKAPMVSMTGDEAPFGLAWKLPTSTLILGKERPSISALLAGIDTKGATYRPDFSIKPDTIPQYSYVDALKGAVPPDAFRGKDVIIAPANLFSPDRFRVPFIGAVMGSQIHAIGAQTLREGFPTDIGFIPALLLAAAFVLVQARRRVPSRTQTILAFALILGAPAVLLFGSINIDIMPALTCLGIGTYRLRHAARATYRGHTELLRIERLHSDDHASGCDVIALKIRNFSTISAILAPKEIEALLQKLQTRLRAAEGDAQFAFDRDTIIWLRETLPIEEREGHLRGLHALFRTSFTIGEQSTDVASALGLDVNYTSSLRERVEGAIQMAEDAAHEGKLFLIGENLNDDDRAWETRFFSELSAAIENSDLHVRFQPKIHLATGQIKGAEALLRWDHPTRGKIDPARIVAFAEEHNRIDMITRFVLYRALAAGKVAIARDPGFRMAVNISALDLRDPTFVGEVRDALARHGYPPHNLILEITETAPIGNDQIAAAMLAELKAMGIGLSVDDFGTGHASLHYLRQIPSEEVKIDRSFVSSMVESTEDRTLVRTAIEMIHSLGRIAVAEGVETEGVARLLIELGCDKAQGYYFSRAVSMEELLPKLRGSSLAA